MNANNAPEMHRSKPKSRAGQSKADSRYWLADGRLVLHDSANYSIQIQVAGRRVWFPLGTPNKRGAAAKAAEVYAYTQSNGLDAALLKFKPKAAEVGRSSATVGSLISTAAELSSVRRHTLDAYSKAFRRIVSEVKGIQSGRKFDALKGGTKEWREEVDAVPLDSISPADIVAWKNRRLRESGNDALAKRSTIVTVNSLIRNAKALLGKKLLPFLEQRLVIPRPILFDGVGLEKNPSLRYVSRVDAYAILARAQDELSASDPEAFKVLVLALVCGLRRSEIDNLLWRAFDFSKRILRVEASEFHELKSEDSAGELDLDANTAALFQGFRARSPKELFVIESANPPRRETKSRCYRCNDTFNRVNVWLRAQGVENLKPLHTMRKEIGSVIASEKGIFEASRYLRHSDIRITSAFYADKKNKVTPMVFAGLLGSSDKIVEITEASRAALPAAKKRVEKIAN
jgi:integrase